jgi:hypothetical protein
MSKLVYNNINAIDLKSYLLYGVYIIQPSRKTMFAILHTQHLNLVSAQLTSISVSYYYAYNYAP